MGLFDLIEDSLDAVFEAPVHIMNGAANVMERVGRNVENGSLFPLEKSLLQTLGVLDDE